MAINFPDSPTNGQTYAVGSFTWQFNGEKWIGANNITLDGLSNVSAATPSSGEVLQWNGAAWVSSSVVGPEGPIGATGADGSDGADGADGADAIWNYLGAYNGGVIYTVGDIVTYGGQLWYRNVYTSAGYVPGGAEGYWDLLAAKGADGINGMAGAAGEPGADGLDGADGNDGAPGATGATGPAGPVVGLDGLLDVSAATPSSGDFLKWNGTAWVNDGTLPTMASPGYSLSSNNSTSTFLSSLSLDQYGRVTAYGAANYAYASDSVAGVVRIDENSMYMDAGALGVKAGGIDDNKVSATANIAYSKLSLSNSITTTDLVSGAARAGFNSTLNAQTTSYTLQSTDLAKLVTIESASNTTVTISNILSVGDRIDLLRAGTGEVTIAGSAVTVNGTPGYRLRAQWSGATLVKLAANTWVVMGDLKV